LQRREAKGAVESITAQIARLEIERNFARDRIIAEVRDSFSALVAAHDALQQTRLNVDLAQQVEDAESERLKQGATDLFALQIREQATFDAKVLDVEAHAEYFRARGQLPRRDRGGRAGQTPSLPDADPRCDGRASKFRAAKCSAGVRCRCGSLRQK